MSVPEYFDNGPVKISHQLNLETLRKKSVIITGGTVHLPLDFD